LKVPILADIVGFIVVARSEYQAYRSGRKILHFSPGELRHVKSEIGPVQTELFPMEAIIDHNIKAPRDGNDQLFELIMCMAAPRFPAGDIIEIVDPLDIERYAPTPINKGEIAARIRDLRKLNNPAADGIETLHGALRGMRAAHAMDQTNHINNMQLQTSRYLKLAHGYRRICRLDRMRVLRLWQHE